MEEASDLECRKASSDFVARVPIQYARRHAVLALEGPREEPMAVALSGLEALESADILSRFLEREVRVVLAPLESIQRAISRAYEERGHETETFIEELDRTAVLSELKELKQHEDLLESPGRSPVVKLLNLLLFDAVRLGASDLHIQPYEERSVARLRIDGVLFDQFDLPRSLHEELSSRVKVIARMDIAERRLAQDGRATVRVGERAVDLRISTVPSSNGERVVIRLLEKSGPRLTLAQLGMSEETLVRFREVISLEHGLILVTGPTGSGKTTTLYAALGEINSKEKNIITLEDPIEYQLEGISQIQVSAKKGMNFASGLRSVLRQDPDLIMVGEIRDEETASMAVQSALTGHLVFSTLHTNDAPSAVARLLDLGIEPYLVSSSLVGVMAQRLVRRLCKGCSGPSTPSDEECRELSLSDPSDARARGLRVASGCERCRSTGLSGRVGLFELLLLDDEIRALVSRRAAAGEIRERARACGMRDLRDDGIAKVLSGLTTLGEVRRVTKRTSL